MSHNVETMMSVKQKPWHGLGVILDAPPNAQEAMVAAGLDWTVEKREMLYSANLLDDPVPCPDRYAVVRTTDGAYLGSAGTGWQPLQNSEAFRFFDPFVQSGEAFYETAGSLEKGRTIWVLARINRDPIEVVKGDVVNKYVLLTNKHHAGFSVCSTLTPIRVVCNNTLTMAMKQAKASNILRANHSNKTAERLADIQGIIAAADEAFKGGAQAYKKFAKTYVNQAIIDQVISETFECSIVSEEDRLKAFERKQVEAVMKLFEVGRGTDIKGVKGTVWGLYNAITEYIQHEKGRSDDLRLRDAWFGSGMVLNNKAFAACVRAVA